MSEDKKYNGWTNYATWRVNLEVFDGSEDQWEGFDDLRTLADALKDYAEELIIDSSTKGLARDYALSFLSDVDWRNIAEHYLPEPEETPETESEVQ